MVHKQEAELKSAFTKELKRQLPDFLSLQLATAGAADRIIVGNGFSSFWEFKHGTPRFESPGLQELTCMRLDRQGFCRYVLWTEDASDILAPMTFIITPKDMHLRSSWRPLAERSCHGFNHSFVVSYIKQVHRL